jgi:phosphorylcholine metabolism protein LicD
MNIKDKLQKIENMDKSINTELNKLVDEVRDCCFVDGYDATTEECIGTVVSRFLGWDGNAIMKIAFEALEDSNFHGLNAELQKTYNDWLQTAN